MVSEKDNCHSILSEVTEEDIRGAITSVRHIFTVVSQYNQTFQNENTFTYLSWTRCKPSPSSNVIQELYRPILLAP